MYVCVYLSALDNDVCIAFYLTTLSIIQNCFYHFLTMLFHWFIVFDCIVLILWKFTLCCHTVLWWYLRQKQKKKQKFETLKSNRIEGRKIYPQNKNHWNLPFPSIHSTEMKYLTQINILFLYLNLITGLCYYSLELIFHFIDVMICRCLNFIYVEWIKISLHFSRIS